MVEGHGVHRVVRKLRQHLMGRRFRAYSPSGRFQDGATEIDGCKLYRVEAIGKELFLFFQSTAGPDMKASTSTVVRIHFGMSGRFVTTTFGTLPAATAKTRLRLIEDIRESAVTDVGNNSVAEELGSTETLQIRNSTSRRPMLMQDPQKSPEHRESDSGTDSSAGSDHSKPGSKSVALNDLPEDIQGVEASVLAAQVSAQVCEHGGLELYEARLQALGPDPLREDADFQRFSTACLNTRRAIGLVLMDQTCIAGVGNIFRAEILYKARVHPTTSANRLSDLQIRVIWHHSVDLLQRGFALGSIITTTGPDQSKRRRYIYNLDTCLCGEQIRCWKMSGRTAYACEACQKPPQPVETSTVTPFASCCAREAPEHHLPSSLTVVELRVVLAKRNLPTTGWKSELIKRLQSAENSTCASKPRTHTSAPTTEGRRRRGVGVLRPKKAKKKGSKTTKKQTKNRSDLGQRKDTPSIPGSAHLTPATAVDAAMEKIAAGENRAVEHVAEADMGTMALVTRKVSMQRQGQQQQRRPLTAFSRSLRPSKTARKATMFPVLLRPLSANVQDIAVHSSSKTASRPSSRWACLLLVVAKIYLQVFGCSDETQLQQLSRASSRCCICEILGPQSIASDCKFEFDANVVQNRACSAPWDGIQASSAVHSQNQSHPELVLDISE